MTREHVLKIMDFGRAKILEAARDQRATLISGTPFYTAPEQATWNAADRRVDLYAFGVTLFELSTGQLPFTQGDAALLHRTAEHPDPHEPLKRCTLRRSRDRSRLCHVRVCSNRRLQLREFFRSAAMALFRSEA